MTLNAQALLETHKVGTVGRRTFEGIAVARARHRGTESKRGARRRTVALTLDWEVAKNGLVFNATPRAAFARWFTRRACQTFASYIENQAIYVSAKPSRG